MYFWLCLFSKPKLKGAVVFEQFARCSCLYYTYKDVDSFLLLLYKWESKKIKLVTEKLLQEIPIIYSWNNDNMKAATEEDCLPCEHLEIKVDVDVLVAQDNNTAYLKIQL